MSVVKLLLKPTPVEAEAPLRPQLVQLQRLAREHVSRDLNMRPETWLFVLTELVGFSNKAVLFGCCAGFLLCAVVACSTPGAEL